MKRREIIEQLLDHLPDYEPCARAAGVASSVGELPRMPAIYWEREVQALYDALARLADEQELVLANGRTAVGRTAHAHLTAFYHSPMRTVRPRRRVRFTGGVYRSVEVAERQWRLERVVSGWLIPKSATGGDAERMRRGELLPPLVEAGVDFVDSHYRGKPVPIEEIRARMEAKNAA